MLIDTNKIQRATDVIYNIQQLADCMTTDDVYEVSDLHLVPFTLTLVRSMATKSTNSVAVNMRNELTRLINEYNFTLEETVHVADLALAEAVHKLPEVDQFTFMVHAPMFIH